MITIYHDPGCIFSQTCLVILRYAQDNYSKVNYKKHPFTAEDLKGIIKKLNIRPIELVQKKHREWRLVYSKLNLTDEEIIQIMIENHDLIERPIIVSGDKAVIGRPPKRLLKLLKKAT